MPDPNPDKEQIFRIDIMACSFKNLSLEQLIEKLTLMKKMNFRHYYTVREDNPEPKIT